VSQEAVDEAGLVLHAFEPGGPAALRSPGCPDPAALASSASPITSPASARRARHDVGSSTCARPHPRHRDRRGTSTTCLSCSPSGFRPIAADGRCNLNRQPAWYPRTLPPVRALTLLRRPTGRWPRRLTGSLPVPRRSLFPEPAGTRDPP